MSGSGGKASALGDPAVHGPSQPAVSRVLVSKTSVAQTCFITIIFCFGFGVICGVGGQFSRRGVAVIVICRPSA